MRIIITGGNSRTFARELYDFLTRENRILAQTIPIEVDEPNTTNYSSLVRMYDNTYFWNCDVWRIFSYTQKNEEYIGILLDGSPKIVYPSNFSHESLELNEVIRLLESFIHQFRADNYLN